MAPEHCSTLHQAECATLHQFHACVLANAMVSEASVDLVYVPAYGSNPKQVQVVNCSAKARRVDTLCQMKRIRRCSMLQSRTFQRSCRPPPPKRSRTFRLH